jgi:ribonuclease HI
MIDQIIDEEGYDYIIFTDGSGHTDKIGASCSIIYNCELDIYRTVVSGRNHTTVPRQEFIALLQALEYINNTDTFTGKCIKWYSDCEALVKSVSREYSRNSNKDLWHMFAYYESEYDIDAEHVVRESEFMQQADLHASSVRQILKDYLFAITE